MKSATSCPSDSAKWRKTEESWNCRQNKRYHCLSNQAKQLVEGCVRPIWIQPGRCPEFNTPSQKLDSSRCRGQFCPSSVYKSNDVVQYKSCFPKSLTPSSDSFSTTRSIVPTTTTNYTALPTTTSHDGTNVLVPAILVPVLVLIVGVCVVIGVIYKKKWLCVTDEGSKAKPENTDGQTNERRRFAPNLKCWERHHQSKPKNRSEGRQFPSYFRCLDRRQQNQPKTGIEEEMPLHGHEGESKESRICEVKTEVPAEVAEDALQEHNGAPNDNQCMNIVEDHFSPKVKDHDSEALQGEMPTLSILSDIVDNLLKTGIVAIIGSWNSYKSTIAMKTIEKAIADKGLQNSQVILVTDIKTMTLSLADDKTLFLYLKDCIKNWSTSNYITAMAQAIKQVRENRKGTTYILLTMRSKFWEEIRRKLNKNIPCIDLNSPETFTQNDRLAILQWHMNNPTGENNMQSQPHAGRMTGVILSYKKPIFQGTQTEIGFMPMVSILCNNKRIQKNMESFLKNPYFFLKNDLEGKSESLVTEDRCHFAFLVYGMLKGGMFSLNQEGDYDLMTKIFDIYSVKDELEKLLMNPPCGIDYLDFIPEKKSYLIKHTIIVRILFQIVSKKDMVLLVKHCNEKLLLDCVVVNEGLRKSCTADILERFRMIYDNGQTDIMDHVFFEDTSFREMFSKTTHKTKN